MENTRPLFIFLGTLVIVGAAFWGILLYASRYEARLAKNPSPAPTVQPRAVPQENQKQNNASSASGSQKAPRQAQPQPQDAATRPVEAPHSGPSGRLPAAGATLSSVATAWLVAASTYLLITLCTRASRLRPNR